jgi:hypothetical protein
MANQRAEAQTSTLAKLAPAHAAARKLGHQLLNFRTGTSFGRRQLCFCGHPDTSTQTPPAEQVCWSDAYVTDGLLSVVDLVGPWGSQEEGKRKDRPE